jgi:hypothetical protein
VLSSDSRVAEFAPTPADVGDYESGVPMRWFSALDVPQLRARGAARWDLVAAQQVVAWHALRLSWRQIGRRMKTSHERARQIYMGGPGRTGAVEMLWHAANGRPVLPWLPAVAEDPLAALRRRNREARILARGEVV